MSMTRCQHADMLSSLQPPKHDDGPAHATAHAHAKPGHGHGHGKGGDDKPERTPEQVRLALN